MMLAKSFLSGSVGLIFSALITQPVNATELQLELDINWDEPVAGGVALDWGGLDTSSDTWFVTLEISDFDLSNSNAIAVTELNGEFSAQITSTTLLPVGINPASGHDSLNSNDAILKQRYAPEIAENGAVVLEDVIRGVQNNVEPFAWWRFSRSISNILSDGDAINSQSIVDRLVQVGSVISVKEQFSKQGVASHSKTGSATIVSASLDGIVQQPRLVAADCRYEIATQWPDGFVGYVFVKNNSDEPLVDWFLNIDFTEGGTIVHSWAADLTGGGSAYSASNLAWNAIIYPGQEINFGFQGVKAPEASGAALVSGGICD